MLLRKWPRQARSFTRCASNAVRSMIRGKRKTEVSHGDFFEDLCKKMLEAMTMAEHEGNLFCKQCYARKYGFVAFELIANRRANACVAF